MKKFKNQLINNCLYLKLVMNQIKFKKTGNFLKI